LASNLLLSFATGGSSYFRLALEPVHNPSEKP
jgi:hypothetical protein